MKQYKTNQQAWDEVLETIRERGRRAKLEAESRGVTYKKIDLGSGPAADYNKGPGNWTGD